MGKNSPLSIVHSSVSSVPEYSGVYDLKTMNPFASAEGRIFPHAEEGSGEPSSEMYI